MEAAEVGVGRFKYKGPAIYVGKVLVCVALVVPLATQPIPSGSFNNYLHCIEVIAVVIAVLHIANLVVYYFYKKRGM